MKKKRIAFKTVRNTRARSLLCIGMAGKRALVSVFVMMLCVMTFAQKVITGNVADSSGPIIGATVIEKGTGNGTVTDIDGNFRLTMEGGNTLVISYVGYLTVEATATDGMQVMLEEDNKQLQ